MNSNIEQTLGTARALHQAGRLNEAEGLYRQILAVDPDHVEGLHLLGVVAHQGGRNASACRNSPSASLSLPWSLRPLPRLL